MGGKYQAYPDYKDSGVAWLSTIPSHWELTRVKYIAELTPKKPSVRRDIRCSFLPMEKLKTDTIVLDESRIIEDVYDGYTYFRDDDILMAKVTPCFENKNIAVAKGLVNQIGFGSSEIYVLRTSKKVSNRYLFYRLQEDSFMDIATAAMTGAGGLKRVPSEVVNNFTAAIPCVREQQSIAAFLDNETAKIDTLIDKQQQLIQLLKEKRQAVISHAVTKGLDPNVPMKDSGVEWLGEVPEHWGIRTVSRFSNKITNGYVGPTRDILVSEGVSYIQATHIKKGVVNFDGAYFVRQSWSDAHSKSILSEGDVLIVQTGAGTGDIGLVSKHEVGFNCHALIIVEPEKKVISGAYLSMVLQSQYGYSKLYSIRTGGMHPHLNCGEVQYVKLPIPPRGEQDRIIKSIEEQTARFDLLISKQLDAISLMQERRTALISAAVTGKIDIRNWQPSDSQARSLTASCLPRHSDLPVQHMETPA